MRKKSWLAPFIIMMSALLVFTGTGLGMFLYFSPDAESLDATLTPDDPENKVRVDDIAENYYFATNTSSSNLYNVYVFPTPYAAEYDNEDYINPISIEVNYLADDAVSGAYDFTNTSSVINTSTNQAYSNITVDSNSSVIKSFTANVITGSSTVPVTFTYGTTTDLSGNSYTGYKSDVTFSQKVLIFFNESLPLWWISGSAMCFSQRLKLPQSLSGYSISPSSYTLTINGNDVTFTLSTAGNTNEDVQSGQYQYNPSTGTLVQGTATYQIGDVILEQQDDGSYAKTVGNITYCYDPSAESGKQVYTKTETRGSTAFTSSVNWYDLMWINSKTTHQASEITATYDDTCEVGYHVFKNYTEEDSSSRPWYYGFWGTVPDGTTFSEYSIINPSYDTNDRSIFGYRTLSQVYKKLTSDRLDSLGDCSTSMKDSNGHIYTFSGYTADKAFAQANFEAMESKSIIHPIGDLFDSSINLSNYAQSGTQNVYLYPIYSSADATDTSCVKLSKESASDSDTTYDMHLVKKTNTSCSSTYFEFNSLLVKNGSSLTSSYHENYCKYFGFDEENNKVIAQDYSDPTKNYVLKFSDSTTNTWDSYPTINFSQDFDSYLEPNCVYNLYVYFNDSGTTIDSTINSNLSSKHIVCAKEYSASNGKVAKVYLERIYSFKIAGLVSGGFDFDNMTISRFLTENSSDESVLESDEIYFSNSDQCTFAINFGSTKSDSFSYCLDSDASSGNSIICYESDTNTAYKTSDGQTVYYSSSDSVITYDDTDSQGSQALPTFTLQKNGVYKIRAKITYGSDGLPSQIAVSAAYIRGLFMEIHINNNFDYIQDSSGNDTDFIQHKTTNTTNGNPCVYRADFADKGYELTADSEVFYACTYNFTTNKYTYTYTSKISLNKVLENLNKKYSVTQLTDHVDENNIFTTSGFSTSSESNVDSFTINKNYVFYASDSVMITS